MMLLLSQLKSFLESWNQVIMYLGQSQKSSRRSWIAKDMIGSLLHQRQRTSIGRNLRTIQWYICYLKQGVVRRSAKISRYLFGKAGSLIGRRRNSKTSPHNAQKNRLREKGGEGSGPSRHTGGSRTHREHARQLAKLLGRPPHPHELLRKTHVKANNEFVDQKSENTYDAIMSEIASASQPENGASVSPSVDFSQIYLDEVGGIKKKHINGLGYQAPFYGHVGSSSASTSRPPNIDFNALVNECVGQRMQTMKEEMKNEMRSEIREEIRQEMGEEMEQELREEMGQGVQQEVHEQVDQILQERMSRIIAGLPTPPSRKRDS